MEKQLEELLRSVIDKNKDIDIPALADKIIVIVKTGKKLS